MDQKCIINMVKNFNEKSQLYNYMRNVIVEDGKKKMLETFGYMEFEEVLLLLLFYFFPPKIKKKETNSLRSGQTMSPTTSEMTSNTLIVQKDDVHSTDGENVCNKKKRKMYMCSNCKNYYVSLFGLKKHQ